MFGFHTEVFVQYLIIVLAKIGGLKVTICPSWGREPERKPWKHKISEDAVADRADGFPLQLMWMGNDLGYC